MTSYVYFIERDGLVKIGYSGNLGQRINQICGTLINFVPGGSAEELRYHKRFADLRVRGEWFRNDPPLTNFLASLPACPEPPVVQPNRIPGVCVNGHDLAEVGKTAQHRCKACQLADNRRYHAEHRDEQNAKRAARRRPPLPETQLERIRPLPDLTAGRP